MSSGTTTARVVAVNVTHAVTPDPGGDGPGWTGIDKRPVARAVAVRTLGLEGDRVLDTRNHGGPDKAVYVYAAEDLATWAQLLGREIPPGGFGENLTTAALDVTGAVAGERWRVGSALLEVTQPRLPCSTFQRHMAEPRWVRRFSEHGAPGAYCRVLVQGDVAAGDEVVVERRPGHGVTVAELSRLGDADPGRLRRLLEEPGLAQSLVDAITRRLGRSPSSATIAS